VFGHLIIDMNKQNIERTVSYNQSQKLEPVFLDYVSAGNWTSFGGNVSWSGVSDVGMQGTWDS
jgi:hypothetical protein